MNADYYRKSADYAETMEKEITYVMIFLMTAIKNLSCDISKRSHM